MRTKLSVVRKRFEGGEKKKYGMWGDDLDLKICDEEKNYLGNFEKGKKETYLKINKSNK